MVNDLQKLNFEIVLVLGYEGTGKSYGIKYLEPKTCFWYNADNKNPTFKNIQHGDTTISSREFYGTKTNPGKFMIIPNTYDDITNHLNALKEKGFLDDNPIAFLLAHVEDYKSEDGEMRQRLKTLGNLATKMNIEGIVENCFYTKLVSVGDKVEFKLDTKNSGTNTCRSLEDAFNTRYIDNNFQLIYDAIKNY